MTPVLATALPVVVAAAVVIGVLVMAVTRSAGTALPVLLDLLLVAGLLRLSATDSWEAIVTATVVVGLRKLTSWGIRTGRRVRADDLGLAGVLKRDG